VRSEILVIGQPKVAGARAASLRAAGLTAWTAVDLDESRRLLDRSWIHPSLLVVDLTPGIPDRAALIDGLAALAGHFELPVLLIGAEPDEVRPFADVRGDLPAAASVRDVIEAIARALATRT
jgi:hypothetical protein